MPFVTNREQRIHYTVEGSGPLVILQHGLLSNASGWAESGYVASLSDRFTVACVDSLGHGESDKPSESEAYALPHRARDLVAVMDDLGRERAHLLGYSMGAWMSVGVARYHPERLASLILGGWDFACGMQTVADAIGIADFPFEMLLEGARSMAPELTQWITPEVEPGLANCFAMLSDIEGGTEAISALDVPVLLWNGKEDPYHAPMQTIAGPRGLAFLSTGGDHFGAFLASDEPIAGIREFLEKNR